MRYIKLIAGNGFCGCDLETYLKFEDGTSDEVIDHETWNIAEENSLEYEDLERDYGIYEEDYDSYDDYEVALCEASEEYYAEITCHWEEVSEEEYNENVQRL